MKTLERAAIEKASKIVAGATKKLSPGKHEVDVLVRVKGTVTKGEDYEQVIWPAVPVLDVLVRLLNVAGCVQRNAVELAVEAVLGGEDVTEDTKKVKGWVTETVNALAEAGVKTCSGKTTADLSVEAVEPFEIEPRPEKEYAGGYDGWAGA